MASRSYNQVCPIAWTLDLIGERWTLLIVRDLLLGPLRFSDLLARLPEASAPLTYCTEMVGALLLNMQRVKARAGGLNPFRALSALRSHGASELETLASLSLGVSLSAEDEAQPSLAQRLLDQIQHYQVNLSRLSEEARSALAQFLEEALEALD